MSRWLVGLLLLPGLVLAKVSDSDMKEVGGLVKEKVNHTLTILRDEKLNKKEKRRQVIAVVDPIFNFELIAKLSLGKAHWSKFDENEREEFTRLFIQQLQDSYFEKIELFTDETVEFESPVEVGGKVQVPTTVLSKDRRYGVIYKMYKKGGKWQVYDVEIEGISLVTSFGLQYDQFLAKNSKKELLEKMRDKVIGPPQALKTPDKIADKAADKTTDKNNSEKKEKKN